MQQRLAAIREKLDRLRAKDSERRVHGAFRGFGHDYVERPPLSPDALARLEAEHRVVLPEELRAFVQTVHSGGPGPGYGFYLHGNPDKLSRSFPYTLADFAALIERKKTDRYAHIPDDSPADPNDEDYPPGYGFMELSHQGCGVFDVIIVTGELRGSVWAYDGAWYACTHGTRLPGFLDWYETWLDQSLRFDELTR